MKRLLIALAIMVVGMPIQGQENAKKWVKSGVWRNGFTKASPDKTVNLEEFYSQYHKNPDQWKALFLSLIHI